MNYRLYVPEPARYSDFRKAIEKGTIIPKKEMSLFEDFKNKPQNSEQSIVDLRVRNINSTYSTRLPEQAIVEITNYIINPNNHFDESLDECGYDAVETLRRKAHSIKRKDESPKDYLSFASKYCHHCRPNKFPIYDSVNVWVFTVLMGYKDQRDYSEFVKCFKVFCSEVINRVALDEDEGFYIDKYIQSIGSGGPKSVHGAE